MVHRVVDQDLHLLVDVTGEARSSHVGQAELLQHLVTLVRRLDTAAYERLDVSLAVLSSEKRKPHSWMRRRFPCRLCVIDHEDRPFHFRQDGGGQSIAKLRNGHCPRARIHNQGDELLKLGLQELEPFAQAFPMHVGGLMALLKYVRRHQVCQRQLSPRNRQGCTDGARLLLRVGCVAGLPPLFLFLASSSWMASFTTVFCWRNSETSDVALSVDFIPPSMACRR